MISSMSSPISCSPMSGATGGKPELSSTSGGWSACMVAPYRPCFLVSSMLPVAPGTMVHVGESRAGAEIQRQKRLNRDAPVQPVPVPLGGAKAHGSDSLLLEPSLVGRINHDVGAAPQAELAHRARFIGLQCSRAEP